MIASGIDNYGEGDNSQRKSCKRKRFKPNYDYEVDYNDHFETPIEAYTDILPLLDLVAPTNEMPSMANIVNYKDRKDITKRRKEHIIYDPYYCNGRTKTILRSLSFDKIIHQKRDFYKDIRDQKVPKHHTLVTNPPYSDDHKQKCIEFCAKQFRKEKITFFLLIPNYVAARSYYRQLLGDTIHDVAYLIPNREYSYSHPEGTGHEESPFSSLWFCCIGRERIKKLSENGSYLRNAYDEIKSEIGRPKFVRSFDELISIGEISLQNRPNPKQRKKMRKIAAQSLARNGTSVADAGIGAKTIDRKLVVRFDKKNRNTTEEPKKKSKRKKSVANSKYRSATGERTKKRF